MSTSFELVQTFPVSPDELYNAWLDSSTHSAMTGGEAHVNSAIGKTFTAWDGYISGQNLSLIQGKEIFQSWRTADFKDSDKDSELTLRFKEVESGCELTLIHKSIPDGQPDYAQGWNEHYFEPMRTYFGG